MFLRRRDLSSQVREALEMICRNVEAETRFVDDLLDLTRIARGRLELAREPLDLHEVVRRAAEVVEPEAAAGQMTLELQLNAARAISTVISSASSKSSGTC